MTTDGLGEPGASGPQVPDHEGARFRRGLRLDKISFLREVPGDWVAAQLGYGRERRCILDDHRSHPRSNYLHRYGDPELVWYSCWPCGVHVNAWDLIRATIAASGFEGDYETATLAKAEELHRRWITVESWEPDETLFDSGASSWSDLRDGEPGSLPATLDELELKLTGARDHDRLEVVTAAYAKQRKERSHPPRFDSFDQVPADFLGNEFGWCADPTYDTFYVPLNEVGGRLASIRYMNAWKKWSERGHALPVLYGLDRRNGQRNIVVVEGITDTVRLAWECRGHEDTLVIGLLSASFDEGRLPVTAFEGCHMTIIGDGGDAGVRATERLANSLIKVASVSTVPLPEGYTDICSYDGDLIELIATAEAFAVPHYLERPNVLQTLSGITASATPVDLERVLRELPPLPVDPLTVTMIRDEIARRLKTAGHRVQIAEAFIKSAPQEEAEEEFAGVAERMAQPEPWPDEVDGRELIDEARAVIKRFVFIADDAVYDVLAAWVLHTFIFEEFPTTSYLHVTAPSMMSGKTRLLEILEEFCRRALLAGGVSPAVLYRAVEMFRPTLLIDEVDTIFKTRSDSTEAIRQVLNNGYTKGKPIFRMVPNADGSQRPVPFDPYCPKAMAGIGRVPDTITSRSITIQMVRKKRGEEAARYGRRQREQLRERATDWKRKAERWVLDHADGFDFDPQFPPGLSDRAQDCWEPLFVVGELIDMDWAERLRTAAVVLNAKSLELGAQDLGSMLLEDLGELVGDLQGEFISSQVLVELLVADDERPWKYLRAGQGLSAKTLAELMRSFEVPPRRFERNTKRGYAVDDIKEAIGRWGQA